MADKKKRKQVRQQITLRLDPADIKKLDAIARDRFLSRNVLAMLALRQFILEATP